MTFALRETGLIAATGMITGLADPIRGGPGIPVARDRGTNPGAVKSASFTGVTNISPVALLITRSLTMHKHYSSLPTTMVTAISIMATFNYISVASDYDFRRRFPAMAGVSLGVAARTLLIGNLIGLTMGIDI